MLWSHSSEFLAPTGDSLLIDFRSIIRGQTHGWKVKARRREVGSYYPTLRDHTLSDRRLPTTSQQFLPEAFRGVPDVTAEHLSQGTRSQQLSNLTVSTALTACFPLSGLRESAQSVWCLLYKREDLSSNSSFKKGWVPWCE